MAKGDDQETELTIRYALPASGSGQVYYLDLAKDLSATNRRLYRQGKVYTIAEIQVTTSDDQVIEISRLQDTWVTANAWKLARKMYNKSFNDGAVQELSPRGKWRDFKVYLDANQETPLDAQNVRHSGGTDWEYSQVYSQISDDGSAQEDALHIHMLNASTSSAGSGSTTNWSSIGAIHAMNQQMPKAVESPDTDTSGFHPADSPYVDLFDTSYEEFTDLATKGDEPPYSRYDLNGADNTTGLALVGSLIPLATTSAKSHAIISNRQTRVPLGLLMMTVHQAVVGGAHVTIRLSKGDYKGVKADSI